MTAKGQQIPAGDVWAEADAVEAQLGEALHRVGVILPSISIDLASAVAGTPLINLGRVNLATARALTKVLQQARRT